MPEQDVILSTQATEAQLLSIRGHVEKASSWAEEHLRLFPNLSSVSVTMGATFGLMFTVTLTWMRK